MAAQKIEITIDGNNITAIKAIDGVETKLKGLGGKAKSAVSGLGNMADMLGLNALNVSVGAAAAGIGVMIKNTIELADNLNDMSKRSGVSVEQLSTLKYAAENSGSSLDGLGTSLKFLNKNIYEASTGNKELGTAFSSLGISVKDAEGKLIQGDQALYQIADRFKSMPDGPEKAALALQIFGRSGTEMIPMLNEGSEGILKMQQEAQNLGMQISTKTAQQMDEFNDKLARVKGSAQGAAVSIVDAFGPAVTSILTNFAEGLDVIFGKAELINGIQFKELPTSIAQANEFTKMLVGTTKEFREEQIKLVQQQFAIAKGEELTAEFKLQQLNTQLGILTLLTDEDNVQEEKLRTAKAQVSALAQQLELLKKINTTKNNPSSSDSTSSSDDKADKEAKKKAEAYTKSLIKYFEYFQKEGQIAGMDVFPSKAYTIPFQLQYVESAEDPFEKVNEKIEEVTGWTLAGAVIMSDEFSGLMGGMADSMYSAFEQMGGASEAWFNVYKAFAIAETVISTIKSAQSAYEWAVVWGGPIAGAIAAAAASATGFARVGQITSVGPGSVGGGRSGGGSSYSPASSITNGSGAQAYANSVTNNSSQRNVNLTVNINGETRNVDELVRRLGPAINRAIKDGIIDFGD